MTALLLLSINGMAQSAPEDTGDGDGTVPIDGGISLLLAAGVAYGIHKRCSPLRKKGEKD